MRKAVLPKTLLQVFAWPRQCQKARQAVDLFPAAFASLLARSRPLRVRRLYLLTRVFL